MSEYDPVRPRQPLSSEGSDLEIVQDLFGQASSGYLKSPWPWLAWAVVLPTTALITPAVAAAAGPPEVLLLWSLAIVIGGVVEGLALRRSKGSRSGSDLTRWVFRAQGNLSLIAVTLTAVLVFQELYRFVPAVWLLLIGHSFFAIGGLASQTLRRGGLIYQAGGLLSMYPRFDSLMVFALTTALANAMIAVSLWRSRRRD